MQIYRYYDFTLFINSKIKRVKLSLKRFQWEEILKILIQEGLSKSFTQNQIESRALKKQDLVEFYLHFCGEKKIRSLNKKYRNKDKVTDVLSFPLCDFNTGLLSLGPLISLGDIFICLPKAFKQAKHFQISLNSEVIHLFVHGFLHLLGYDHERSKKDEKKMQKVETRLVTEILKKLKV